MGMGQVAFLYVHSIGLYRDVGDELDFSESDNRQAHFKRLWILGASCHVLDIYSDLHLDTGCPQGLPRKRLHSDLTLIIISVNTNY